MDLSQNYQSFHFILEPEDFLALKNETRCAICLDVFEDPVTTFCQHTYCRKCLEGYIKSCKTPLCPLCKMPVGKRNYIADKKAAVLAQVILNIKPVKRLIINETPKRDLLSIRKRKASDISSVIHRVFESEQQLSPPKLKRKTVSSDEEERLIVRKPCLVEQESNQSKIRQKTKQRINILVSNMPDEFQHEVDKFCRLYKAKEFKDLNDEITHVVVFPIESQTGKVIAKRTLKYLCALVNGIWIVAFNWIIHSNGYEELKEETEFEVQGDPYGMNTPRESRLRGGMKDMLENMRFILSETSYRKEHISKKEFKALIECAGGEVVEQAKCSDDGGDCFHICISSGQTTTATPSSSSSSVVSIKQGGGGKQSARDGRKGISAIISHKWLLDSISKGKLLNFKNYI